MTNHNSLVTGGCLCGAIRYESEQAPYDAGYCHCTMCQKGLGSLFGAAALFKNDHFRFISGKLKWYETEDMVKRGFCGECGSPITYQRPESDHLVIWIGTLDNPEACEPKWHGWTDSKISWVDIHSHLPDNTKNLPSYKAAMRAMEQE